MAITLRIFLAICSLGIFITVCKKVKRSEIQISDSLFWLIFVGIILLISIFPQIVYFLASLLGINSPANLVFLLIAGILILHGLSLTVKTAILRLKFECLVQELAIKEHDKKNDW